MLTFHSVPQTHGGSTADFIYSSCHNIIFILLSLGFSFNCLNTYCGLLYLLFIHPYAVPIVPAHSFPKYIAFLSFLPSIILDAVNGLLYLSSTTLPFISTTSIGPSSIVLSPWYILYVLSVFISLTGSYILYIPSGSISHSFQILLPLSFSQLTLLDCAWWIQSISDSAFLINTFLLSSIGKLCSISSNLKLTPSTDNVSTPVLFSNNSPSFIICSTNLLYSMSNLLIFAFSFVIFIPIPSNNNYILF